MKISRKSKAFQIKQGRPSVGATKQTHRVLLVLTHKHLREIDSIRDWYRSTLKIKTSRSFILRTSLDEFVVREKAKMQKTEHGRYHAKVRTSDR